MSDLNGLSRIYTKARIEVALSSVDELGVFSSQVEGPKALSETHVD